MIVTEGERPTGVVRTADSSAPIRSPPSARTRLLFLVGDGDHLFTPDQRTEIASRLEADGVDHEFVVYPDTPHGFFCDERDTYRPEAAEDAFARVTKLLAAIDG